MSKYTFGDYHAGVRCKKCGNTKEMCGNTKDKLGSEMSVLTNPIFWTSATEQKALDAEKRICPVCGAIDSYEPVVIRGKYEAVKDKEVKYTTRFVEWQVKE